MWSILKKFRRREPPPPPPDSREIVLRWLEGAEGGLLWAVESLARLMADPVLGGPGFLTVRLPRRGEAWAAVSCQYPNLSEVLYRAVLRGAAADLLEAGVSPALLDRGLSWEAEGGAVVTLTLEAAPVRPELAGLLDQLHSRNRVVGVLAGELARRCPGFSVRVLAGDLLLTPEKGGEEL